MTLIYRCSIASAALALATVLVASPAFAQQPSPSAPAPEMKVASQAAQSIEGELMKVDVNAKTLVVKTDDGKEEQLAYTEATKVTGGETGIAGLAKTSGTRVTVRFTGSGESRVASEIMIQQKKS